MKNGIQIPVKPHVLKYLNFHLGAGYQLSENDHFGLFLFYLLRRPVTDARKDQVVAKYTARFDVHYGCYSPHQYGFRGMTGKTVYQFNNFVHKIILSEMHGYIDMATDFGITVKYAIEAFMQKHSFTDEDVAYDTLLKSWQRFSRQRNLSKKKVVPLTPRKMLKQLERDLCKVPVAMLRPRDPGQNGQAAAA